MLLFFFFFKQKTAYEMRISDWSSDVCSSDLRKASSRNSAVMVRSPGDKIIIALGADRHWIYFSVGEERDSGSIVDFVQNRQGGTLGDVRKELRPWLEGRSPGL